MSWEESRKRLWPYFQQLLRPCARAPNPGPRSPNRVSYAQPRSSPPLKPPTLQQRGIECRGKGGRWGCASGWEVEGDDVGTGDMGRGSRGGSRGEIK